MRSGRRFLFSLSSIDRQLLRCLSRHTGTSESQVLRWALRYYCCHGSWIREGVSRLEVFANTDSLADLDVGPSLRRVTP